MLSKKKCIIWKLWSFPWFSIKSSNINPKNPKSKAPKTSGSILQNPKLSGRPTGFLEVHRPSNKPPFFDERRSVGRPKLGGTFGPAICDRKTWSFRTWRRFLSGICSRFPPYVEKRKTRVLRWWKTNQPIWDIFSQNWIISSSRSRDLKKKQFETTT